jgi:hypothetical protein
MALWAMKSLLINMTSGAFKDIAAPAVRRIVETKMTLKLDFMLEQLSNIFDLEFYGYINN